MVDIASYPGLPMFFNVSREKPGRSGYEAMVDVQRMVRPIFPREYGMAN